MRYLEGRSGGIAVLWKSSDVCTVIGYSRNHIDLKISEPGETEWLLTGYYGFLNYENDERHVIFFVLSLG